MKSIYVIENSKGQVKIGVTKNIEARLKQIQCGNPEKLKIMHISYELKNPFEVEAEIHKALNNSKCTREWFDINTKKAIDTTKEVVKKIGIPVSLFLPCELKIMIKEQEKEDARKRKEIMQKLFHIPKNKSIEENIDFDKGWKVTEDDRELIESEIKSHMDVLLYIDEIEDYEEYKQIYETIKSNSLEECKDMIQKYAFELSESVNHYIYEYYKESSIREFIEKTIVNY